MTTSTRRTVSSPPPPTTRRSAQGMPAPDLKDVATNAAALGRGQIGESVRWLQEKLGMDSPDGQFGPKTEEALKAFQRGYGLEDDGKVGARTLKALGWKKGETASAKPPPAPPAPDAPDAPAAPKAPKTPQRKPTPTDPTPNEPVATEPAPKWEPEAPKVTPLRQGMSGENVRQLQQKLNVDADGDFGPKTAAAVRAFQKRNGMTVDGVAGAQVLTKLGLAKAGKQAAPGSVDALKQQAMDAVDALKPGAIQVSPLKALDAVGDGTALVQVPLKPGKYKMGIASFKVEPGTVATMKVQVKNGQLVPADGNKGTQVKINPPLDAPLWITVKGARLEGDNADAKIRAELGGFFDITVKQLPSLKLSEVAESFASAKGGSDSTSKLFTQMVDFSTVSFDANVNMRAKQVDLGGVQLKVGPGTQFTVKGARGKAHLEGKINLADLDVKSGGFNFDGASGKGRVSADLTIGARGNVTSTTTVSVDEMNVNRLSTVGRTPAGPQKLEFGPTTLTQGTIVAKTGPNGPEVSAKFKAQGEIKSALLTVKDAKDNAALAVQGGRFNGTVDVSPTGAKVDLSLKGTTVSVDDLQASMVQPGTQGSVSVKQAKATGDVKLSVDTSTHQFDVDATARSLAVTIDDAKGKAKDVDVDVGTLTMKGGGRLQVSTGRGVTVDGALEVAGTLDSVKAGVGEGQVQLTKGSTVKGTVEHVAVGQGAVELKVRGAEANLNVGQATLKAGDATLQGAGTVRGAGSLSLDASGLKLDGTGEVSIALADGKVHTSTVALDFAKGSRADLVIKDLAFGKTTSLTLDKGSKIDAALDGGTIQVAGETVTLQPGGRATFDIDSVKIEDGKAPQLRGRVGLDVRARGDQLGLQALAKLTGTPIAKHDVEAGLKLDVPDAQLSDGKLSLANANLTLDAKVGRVLGAQTPGTPAVGSLAEPPKVLSKEQVQGTTAAQLAGVTAPATPGNPLEALKLLKDGTVAVKLPLSGKVDLSAMIGMDGLGEVDLSTASADLKLVVKDGKIVPADTSIQLNGVEMGGPGGIGVKRVTLGADGKPSITINMFGGDIEVPAPVNALPLSMDGLLGLVSGGATPAPAADDKQAKVLGTLKAALMGAIDKAEIKIQDATFKAGTLALPGAEVKIGEGSKLSFEGTPLAGKLTGQVKLDGVTVARDDVALTGSGGTATLNLDFKRDGEALSLSGGLTDVAISTQGGAYRLANGDYVHLGPGQLERTSLSFKADAKLVNGKPQLTGFDKSALAVDIGRFQGQLLGGRISNVGGVGQAELGPLSADGAVSMGPNGLKVKAKVESVDALLKDVTVSRGGRQLDIESARLKGAGGTIDLGGDRLAFETQPMGYDVVLKAAKSAVPGGEVELKRTRITGEGKVKYATGEELVVEGNVRVEGALAAQLQVPDGALRRKIVLSKDRTKLTSPA